MKKEETAIQWFYKKLKNYKSLNLTDKLIQDLFKEALQTERKQILDAYYQGADDESNEHGEMYLDLTDAERYYNSNYEV